MVRKAETLKSIDELNVSARTRSFLKKLPIDQVVERGRFLAYYCNKLDIIKRDEELMTAVKEARFVRPKTDFDMSFRIGILYSVIFPDNREAFISRLDQLSNEQYESFVGISDEDVDRVKISLHTQLKEEEYRVVCRRFGLYGNEDQNLESVARYFDVSIEHIRKIEARAIRKLKKHNTLPALFDAPSSLSDAVTNLKSELDKLHKDPIFKRERELLIKLESMEKLPFRYYDSSRQINLSELLDSTPIAKLGLSTRTYTCLRRAGIDTISDVVGYPKDAWGKVRNLEHHNLAEVVAKMHSAGYKDFSVDI